MARSKGSYNQHKELITREHKRTRRDVLNREKAVVKNRPEVGSKVIFVCKPEQKFAVPFMVNGAKCTVVSNYLHTIGIKIGRHKKEYIVHPDFVKMPKTKKRKTKRKVVKHR